MELNWMHWLTTASQEAATALVSGIWQGLALALAIALSLRLVPRISAASRFAVWAVAFLLLSVLPFVHFAPGPSSRALASPRETLLHLDMRWALAMAALWVLLSITRAVFLVLSAFKLRAIWRNAKPAPLPERSGRTPSTASVDLRKATVFTSTAVDRPSLIGFFAPRILVPAWLFDQLSAQELEQVILHEQEHLRRHDDWMNLLQKIGLALLPLNPALLWIERRLCLERELACDDGVVSTTHAPRAYAECLAALAERGLGRRAAALSLATWERRPALVRRVHRVLSGSAAMSQTRSRMLAGLMACGLLLAAVGLSRCPRIVSFSSGTQMPHAELKRTESLRPSPANITNLASTEPRHKTPEVLKVMYSNTKSSGARRPHQTLRKPLLLATTTPDRAHVPEATEGDLLVVATWDSSGPQSLVFTLVSYRPHPPHSSSLPAINDGWIFFQL